MKNIYKTTRGQLISIWIFGLIGFGVALENSDYSGFATFLSVLIPAILVFYTIGWRSFNKITGQEFKISRFLPSRKKVILIIVFPIFISFIISIVSYFINTREDNLKKEQLEQEYNQTILVVDSLRERFTSCMATVNEQKYKEALRSCNLLKNKVRADYDFCIEYTSVSPRASCLYTFDYEIIDCSQKTLDGRARLDSLNSIPESCDNMFMELVNANKTIKEYSELNKINN